MDPPTDSPPESSHNLFEVSPSYCFRFLPLPLCQLRFNEARGSTRRSAPSGSPLRSNRINLQWSELCFTEEDIEQWSLVPFNTDGNEEVKDTSYEVNNSLNKSEEAAVLESNNIVAEETFHSVSPLPDVPVQLGIDVSYHFSTDQVFNSRETLIQWCQDAGKQLNMVIIIHKSEKPSWKGRGRLLLCCERGGPQDYRKRIKKKDKHEVKPIKPSKAKNLRMCTKKCDCPFKLKGVPLEEGKWKLQVSCGIHNHELTETSVGRPRTSQLINKEKNALIDVTSNGVSPIEVLPILECQNAENCPTTKTTYNAKAIVSLGDIDERNASPVPDSHASLQASGRGQLIEGPAPYKHIERNEFSYRKHKKQKVEDIVICECRYDENDPDSACGERCLNVLTSTECTPDYCPCGNYCQNQKFQKCEYAMTKLFRSEGRGWGLLAEENIKAGQFVIEYCGEVISCKEAKRRSHTYEAAGLKDAYIIYLNANESIDATKKGSLARFINHSCQPNCETRKWTVLGEVRVGIFAKQDIPIGTELAYDYNFEWYGGAKVRCRCGASSCSEFLGAKSRGFQEATYLWEDDDDRYSIEKVPLYDSEDDEPISKLFKTTALPDNVPLDESEHNEHVLSVSMPIVADPLDSIHMEMDEGNNEQRENSIYIQDTPQDFTKKSALIPRIQSSSCRIYHIESSPLPKRSRDYSNGRSKNKARKEANVKQIVERLVSKEARAEIIASQEKKSLAAAKLDMLYDEIRPVIEEHERDSQDCVPTSVAEKWIVAHCENMRSEFDFFSTIIKNIACASRSAQDAMSSEGVDTGIDIKPAENKR